MLKQVCHVMNKHVYLNILFLWIIVINVLHSFELVSKKIWISLLGSIDFFYLSFIFVFHKHFSGLCKYGKRDLVNLKCKGRYGFKLWFSFRFRFRFKLTTFIFYLSKTTRYHSYLAISLMLAFTFLISMKIELVKHN